MPFALTYADPFPRIDIAAPASPITFQVTTGGFSPNLIALSSDLKVWENYLTVYSKVPYFRLVDLATVGGGEPWRFYRMRIQDSQSTSQMRNGWTALGFTNYQFQLTRICFCTPTILSGRVTVKNGKVTAVTDARGADGVPIQNPDLSQFKSMEDLFDLVQNDQLKADVLVVVLEKNLATKRP